MNFPPLLYPDAGSYLAAPHKAVAVFGMSGLGKTWLARLMRQHGNWFHYSVDYRIGTRYMGEHIADNFKRAAMSVPLLRELLLSDSVYIGSNITFENLSPLSTYMGKPGDPARGGIAFEEYLIRQRQHKQAEISALCDTPHFIQRARSVYGYAHFLCDTGGSICEVVDPADPDDRVLKTLCQNVLLVQIRGTKADTNELMRRFAANPKPMYYPEDFLHRCWQTYLDEYRTTPDKVDPDDFIRWGFQRLLEHRLPRYDAIAENWGISIDAHSVAKIEEPADFNRLVADAITART